MHLAGKLNKNKKQAGKLKTKAVRQIRKTSPK